MLFPRPKKLSEIRNEYMLKHLNEKDIEKDPFLQLNLWIDEAISGEACEPTAMALSTVSSDGKPTSRIVLLKELSDKGLVFFTNYESQKGKDLINHPQAASLFFWAELQRQVRIEGKVQKISENESSEYFNSRPRGSQLSALSSPQSTAITREKLEKLRDDLEKKYEGKDIPKPSNWGGYILIPDYFEFWQGRENRLHDRLTFSKKGSEWKIERLAP
jgi:pyridoxamine 5'-phosphate oxidase